jgi:hypothetical protein
MWIAVEVDASRKGGLYKDIARSPRALVVAEFEQIQPLPELSNWPTSQNETIAAQHASTFVSVILVTIRLLAPDYNCRNQAISLIDNPPDVTAGPRLCIRYPDSVLAFRLETEAEMPENKTKATTLSVSAYVDALTDPARRSEAKELIQLMQRASGEKPRLWGLSIIGFGSYHYKYDSGREGDMPLISFSPRKTAIVLYSMLGHREAKVLLAKLGKHATGKGCLYIKKLAHVDRTILEALIRNAADHNRPLNSWGYAFC